MLHSRACAFCGGANFSEELLDKKFRMPIPLSMEWFLTGLAFAFFNSITMLINQRYKLDGHLISAMRGVFVGVAYLPFLFFVKIPHSVSFWLLVVVEGALSAFFNARLCASSARFGAASTRDRKSVV